MMRIGWQVFSGTEFRTHKGVLSFAMVGHRELHAVLQNASNRQAWERAETRLPTLALVGEPLKLAMQHLRTSGEQVARALFSLCSWARCGRRIWSGLNVSHCTAVASSVEHHWALFGTGVTSVPPLRNSDEDAFMTSTSKIARPLATVRG